MLEELSIRNYALIDSISLSFGIGFNVLTGETGAGKSIIVDSLSFLMGAKTGEEIIRTGCDEASVTALVSIKDANREALDWLAGRDIETEDGTVIIRRTVKKSGRSSVFIQNVPLTRTDLADFMGLLFDLHGQHNHESLLKKENHRRYLDRFAGIEDEVAAFTGVFTGLSEKRKALESSLSDERDRGTRLELLAYAAEEITKAAVRAGEIRELENESQRLSDFEKLANLVTSTAESLYDGELSVLSLARNARTSIDAAAAIDNALAETQKRLDDLFYEADDISREFRSYRDQLTYDPRRLAEVDERLALLYQLKKKYAQAAAPNQGAEDAILEYLARSQAEIETLSGAGENREKLIGEIAVLEKDLAARAASLRQKRKAAALRLGDAITGILKSLGMPNACFSVSLLPKGRAPAPEKENTAGQQGSQSAAQGSQSAGLVCGPWGAEDVE
ncbi:MAG: AAA family ATPase, partial [Treponema sp.]|nr:AAA family ATPase [Treponema sp.]